MNLAKMKRHEEAIDRYRDAIGHLRSVFDRLPQATQFRKFLTTCYWRLGSRYRSAPWAAPMRRRS